MRYLAMGVFFILSLTSCGRPGADGLTFSGTLEITEHQLGFKAAGRVVAVSVEEGDLVKAGQVLATLDRYEQSKKDLARAEALFAQGGVDQQTVELARLSMDDQQVVAPIDGVVLVKVQEVGEIVAPGVPVVVIGDTQDQWVRIFIPEGQINRISVGQKAILSLDGLDKNYSGRVSAIATKAEFTPRNVQTPEERVTQGFAVKVAVSAADLKGHPGVAVDVRFEKSASP